MDFAAIYRESRLRITDLVGDLNKEQLETIVPACPDWTVQDTVAHLTGIACDIVDGVPAAASDRTAEQVALRRGLTIAAVCDEWAEAGPRLEELIDQVGSPMASPVIDAWTHEQDIRGALGLQGIREGHGLELTLKSARMVGPRLDAAGLAPIALTIPGAPKTYVLGTAGEPGISLTGDRYELARAFMARRSMDQVAGLDWSADPTEYLPHIGMWEPPTADLID